MSKTSGLIRIILLVLSWLIFVGLCINASIIIVNTVATLAYGPEGAKRLWREADLTGVYQFNQARYVTLTSIMIIVALLKALMFYLIIRILHDKRLNIAHPFNEAMRKFVLLIAYISLGIGLFCHWGADFSSRLVSEGAVVPSLEKLKIAGADVWIFMGVVMLIIGFLFRKAVELQNEHELTV